MYRVLIADSSVKSFQYIQDKLGDQFDITFCDDGKLLYKIMHDIDPDIMFLSLNINNTDGLTFLRDIRSSGNRIPVAVTMGCSSEYALTPLNDLRISKILLKPWKVDSLIATIIELADEIASDAQRNIEDELHYILLRLGFKAGVTRYDYIYHAVLERYKNQTASLTKEIYPKVASIVTGGSGYVEKGIRDGIRYARGKGSTDLWLAFFPSLLPGKVPSNEEFLGRIALALHMHERPRKQINGKSVVNI